MKSSSTLVTACLFAGIVSASVTSLLVQKSGPETTAPDSLTPDAGGSLESEVQILREGQERLTATLAELRMEVAASSGSRVSMGAIQAAVREYLEGAEAPELEKAKVADLVPAAAFDKDSAIAQLLADDLSDEDRQRLWNQLSAAGHADEIIAAFEARVEADPNDPDRRVDLGHVYLQQIQEVGNGPLAGVLATKADQAFDAALELDETHWDARFSKAVALSFWPPVFGKQNAAIQQFELLAENQATMPVDPNHAQTHLLLGNMYQQIGAQDKALAAWQAGAQLFPNHQGLLQQLALSQDD